MPRGGKRSGSGRPKGSGKYGEPTKSIRLPISLVEQLEQLQASELGGGIPMELGVAEVMRSQHSAEYLLPLYMVPVAAGFPSPAEDYIEGNIDLNRHLVKNPAATFLVRVTGDSMIAAGIHSGDVLVVDRSLEASQGKIVIAVLNGELTVKRIHYGGQRVFLMPENPDYPAIAIDEEAQFQVWGVVTNVIHPV